MQEKLQREEEELRREKQRLMEERESQRLQRYVTASHAPSNRPAPADDPNRHAPATSADRPTGSDNVTDRQQSDAGGRGQNVVSGHVFNDRQRFAVDDDRAGTVPSDLASSRQYQQQQQQLQQQQLQPPQQQLQQTGSQGRGNPVSATTNERPETSPVGQYHQLQQQQQQQQLQPTSSQVRQNPLDPASSPHPLAPSVQPGTNLSPRQSQQTGPGTPQDRNPGRQFVPVRSDQFSPPADHPRFAAQPRGYADPIRSGPAAYSDYNNAAEPRHWRQSSYDGRDWRNVASRTYNQPDSTRSETIPYQNVRGTAPTGIGGDHHRGGPYARTSTSSQPDLQRYLDPGPAGRTQSSRVPPRESLRMLDDAYNPRVHPPPPAPPSHSRSASNPVTLRAQGSNASAVDSLFAYHQKLSPPAVETPPQRSGSLSSPVTIISDTLFLII